MIALVNRTVRDVWIEGYLEALERWRIQARAQGVVLAHLRGAWRAYGQYRASGDRSLRWRAWRAIQAAAERLAHSRPIARKEVVT
jgi:hypothetical protein